MATKKAPPDQEVHYAYRVRTYITSIVEVERFVLVSRTNKTLTVVQDDGTHKREGINTVDHEWFFDSESAFGFANDEIKKRIAEHTSRIEKLKGYQRSVKDKRLRVRGPGTRKTDIF